MSDIDKFVASSESDHNPHSAVAGQLDSLSQQLSAATKANPELGAVVADLKSKLPAAKAKVKAAAAHYKKMTCIEGTECYDKENLSDLEWKYNHARSVEKRAPRDVITAKKTYIPLNIQSTIGTKWKGINITNSQIQNIRRWLITVA